MGGYGSGWYRPDARALVEDSRRLAVGELVRAGVIAPDAGRAVRWCWWLGEELRASVNLWALTTDRDGTLRVGYRASGRESEQDFDLVTSPLPWGGPRWWVRCACGRRVAALYWPPGRPWWACRTCHRLAYQSTRENPGPGATLLARVAALSGVDVETARRLLR
jgi:hypothetical protein